MPRPKRDGTPASAPNKHKLNDLFLKRLKPQPRPQLVWDAHTRGLAVQVQPTGRKSFKVIYRRNGRPRWQYIGDVSAIGLTDARKMTAQIMLQVAEGKDPGAERKAARSNGTFQEVADRYRAYAQKKNKSWKQADAFVRRNLLPRWAKLRAADITRSDVKAMMAGITAPITANQTLAAASAVFAWAIREEVGGVTVNPCTGVERNETKTRERVLSDTEVPRFWSACDSVGLVGGTALKVLLLTGQRPGEVAHMRREHIEGNWWTLPGEPVELLQWPGTKNGRTHRVWLPEAARKLIDNMDGDGMVFTGSRHALNIAMNGICDKLGGERATPHDLRRTHGSTITGLNFGRPAMNRIQNHKEGGISDVYDQHEYADENRHIMETVAQHILALVEGKTVPTNVVALKRSV